jgi:hypothetical protein
MAAMLWAIRWYILLCILLIILKDLKHYIIYIMENQNNKYANAKIYAIKSYQTDKYYIGSTIHSLTKRLSSHKMHKKNYDLNNLKKLASFDILQYDDYYIELLENYSCNNRNELEAREKELILLHRNNVVNKYKINDAIDIKMYMKEYRERDNNKYKTSINCECGGRYTISNIKMHIVSNLHLNYKKSLNNN